MVKYKKFILDDFPRSAVVNSTVYDNNADVVDNFINDIVSKHINSIVEEESEKSSSISNHEGKLIDLSKKVVDGSSEKYNITGNHVLADEDFVDIEAIKKEEYEKGVADTISKYQPLLDKSSLEMNFANLLQEKLSSIVPQQSIDIQVAKVSAESISAIAKKLHLVLPANFEEIIIGGLISKLKNFYKEGEITITVHPDRYDFCEEILQSSSIPGNLKDNFHIVKDSRVGTDDCSLEWQNTRLEYNQEQLSQEIDKIIEQLKTAS